VLTDDLLSFLAAESVAATPVSMPDLTPFPVIRVGDRRLWLHLVEPDQYVRETPRPAFFQELSDQFQRQGDRLIHLWADVWRQKPAVVQSRLRALAGSSQRIPGRLTRARRIDRPTATAFLEKNHLQVVTQSKFNYGLFLPARYFRVLSDAYRQSLEPESAELLVAVATFSHPRTIPRNGQPARSVELVRFASRLDCTVVGGLDKLLKAFIAAHHPDDIMTYADRDWSAGRSYEQLGFARVGVTQPHEFWLDPATGHRHYPHRLPETAPHLIRIYNAGSIKFVLACGVGQQTPSYFFVPSA